MLSKVEKPFLIGVSGGGCSGKTEVCQKIREVLTKKSFGNKAVILSLSSFYPELSAEEHALAEKGELDFDHPNSFDFKHLADVLRRIKRREPVTLRLYDCTAHSIIPTVQEISSDMDVVIVEGILTFYQKDIRDMFHLKIFVESDADTRLSRKVIDDVLYKGRPLASVLENYFKFVKPGFEDFCLPTKKYADVILPRAPDNPVGVDLITEHLIQMLNEVPQCTASRVRNQSESCIVSIRPH